VKDSRKFYGRPAHVSWPMFRGVLKPLSYVVSIVLIYSKADTHLSDSQKYAVSEVTPFTATGICCVSRK